MRGIRLMLTVTTFNMMAGAFSPSSMSMSNLLQQRRLSMASTAAAWSRRTSLGSLKMQIDPLSRRRCMQVVAAAAPLLLWEGRADAINLDTMSVFGYGRESGTGRGGGGGGGLLSNPFGQTNKIKEQRPKPIRIPSTFLFLQFTVLLMRSCYNTVDDLDFFPMNQFQKDFFLLRQDEWEKYIKENDVKQGDLTNALYFDFISSAQFASITQSIQGAKQIFEETSGVENDKHVIQRDPMLKDDNLLAPRFFMRSGEKYYHLAPRSLCADEVDRMYDGLLANFTDDSNYVKPPLPSRLARNVFVPSRSPSCCSPNAPFSEVLKSFNSIYQVRVGGDRQAPTPRSLSCLTIPGQIFQNNGYAMKIDVEDAGAASTQEYIQAKGVYEDWAKKIQDKV